MSYSDYITSIIERYRVKLTGWTYKDFVSPSKIGTITDIRNLRDALREGHCYWIRLSRNEVEAYLSDIQNRGEEIRRARHQRSDKGKVRKRKQRIGLSEEDENVENEPPAKKVKGRKGQGKGLVEYSSDHSEAAGSTG